MSKTIGVANSASLERLKSWLLFFDNIAVVQASDRDWDFRPGNPRLATDLDWLREREIVFTVNAHSDATVNIQDVKYEGRRVVVIPKPGPASIHIVPVKTSDESPTKVSDLINALRDIVCRLECETLRTSKGVDAISLHPPSPKVFRTEGVPTVLGNALNVVIKSLPQPSEATSLERILEFRNDPATKGKLLSLRRWTSKLSKEGFSERELADELEWLLHQYEEHMHLHQMKINKGALETLITVTGELVESLLKMKWGTLTKLPFAISNRKIELLEAEARAPGREIAFVAHARKTFGSR